MKALLIRSADWQTSRAIAVAAGGILAADCPLQTANWHSPPTKYLPPRNSYRRPDNDIQNRSDQADRPPTPLRYVAEAEIDRGRSCSIMRQPGAQIGEISKQQNCQSSRCADGDSYHKKRDEHCRHMRSYRCEGIMCVKEDKRQDRQCKRPTHAGSNRAH